MLSSLLANWRGDDLIWTSDIRGNFQSSPFWETFSSILLYEQRTTVMGVKREYTPLTHHHLFYNSIFPLYSNSNHLKIVPICLSIPPTNGSSSGALHLRRLVLARGGCREHTDHTGGSIRASDEAAWFEPQTREWWRATFWFSACEEGEVTISWADCNSCFIFSFFPLDLLGHWYKFSLWSEFSFL